MDSLRMEKGYRGWKGDIDRNVSPLDAGFERLVDFGKGDFVGRAALLALRDRGPVRRIVTLALDDPGDADAPVEGVVWRGGRRIGTVTSSAYGHAIRRSLSLAIVDPADAEPGNGVEVEMFGALVPAAIVSDSPYDPTHSRLRA
jgi:dimethylglycine dehydrogenase